MTRSIVLALAALLIAAPLAGATTPGRNGPIVMGVNTDAKYPSGNDANLVEVQPKTGKIRTHTICEGVSTPERTCRWMWDLATSPDGTEAVAYTTGWDPTVPGGMSAHLRFMARGNGSVRVAPLSCSWCDVPSDGEIGWYPDGSALVATPGQNLTAEPPQISPGVFKLGLDGAEQGPVLGAGTVNPAWSAQGRLAFARDGNLLTVRAGEAERVLAGGGASEPSWSPHGGSIAFSRCSTALRCDLYVVSRKGGKARRVVRDGSSPAWSPDGRYIAFLRFTKPKMFDAYDALSLFRLDRRTGRIGRMTPELTGAYGAVTQPQWTALPR